MLDLAFPLVHVDANMVHGWPLPFCGVDREVLLWGSVCHHVKREASRFIPSIPRMADFMRAPNMPGLAGYEHGTPGILMIPGVVAQAMAGLGWTKAIREFLWEHSGIPAGDLRRAGCPAWIEIDASKVVRESLALDPWPITASPDNFVIIVAGGGHPTNSYCFQGYSRAIELSSAARSSCRRRSRA